MAQEGVFVAASSSHGGTEDVLEGCALSIAVSLDFLTPTQSFSSCSGYSGGEATTTSAASGPFFSARIQSLGERRNNLGSELEFEIKASQCHWTEPSVATSDFDDEEQRVRDSVAFKKLKAHPEWGPFFRRQPYELEIDGRITEGGQAEIFEALGTNKHKDARYVKGKTRLVLKVFKKAFSLNDMQ